MSEESQAETKSDVTLALERLDEAVRDACAAMNNASESSAVGVATNWVMIVDERFYSDGQYVGGYVCGVAKPEQPRYVSQMVVREFCERTGVEFVAYDEDPEKVVDEE